MTTKPVYIVSGIPRSGTSVMMNMLGEAGLPLLTDEERPADASNPRGYFELEAVRRMRDDLGWLDEAPGHGVKVIHRLLAALPLDRTYRVILMGRPLEEVVASQTRMLEAMGGRPPDPMPESRLEEIFAEQLDETRALLDREPAFEWIEVEYHDLLADPVGCAARVAEFLGLTVDAENMARPVDPALYRTRLSAPD
jgi:hypothetical protein